MKKETLGSCQAPAPKRTGWCYVFSTAGACTQPRPWPRAAKGQPLRNLHFLRVLCVCVYEVLETGQWHVAPVPSSSAQAAITKYHRPGAYTTDIYLLSVLVAGKSKVKVPADLVLVRPPSWLKTAVFSLCPHGRGGRESSLVCLLIRTLIPSDQSSPKSSISKCHLIVGLRL